jgi:hypothetical protein
MAIESEDRCGWAAILYRPGVGDVVGPLRGSARLHWTPQAARQEAQDWIEAMRIGPVTWASIDDQMVIGHGPTHVIVVRSVLLPRGKPRNQPRREAPQDRNRRDLGSAHLARRPFADPTARCRRRA